MSNRNNDVSKVLVTTGDQDVLAAGQPISALSAGQVGFFNADTLVAVDEGTTAIPNKILIAVGGDKVLFSGGQYVDIKRTANIAYRPHTPGQDQKVKITNFVDGECDADYNVKIELRDQQKYRSQGYNQFTKTFSVRTGCCVGSQISVDGNDIALLLKGAINLDQGGEFSAIMTARQPLTNATHGTAGDISAGAEVPDSDIAALVAYNAANDPSVYVDVEITFNSLAIKEFSSINLQYYHPRQIVGIVSPLEDMVCIGASVEQVQALAFTEGSGYDVQQKEYHETVTEVGSYKTFAVSGTAKPRKFQADSSLNYDQFDFEYALKSNSGWLEYENPIHTLLAIPSTASTTLAAVAAVIDNLWAGQGFDEVATDVTAANDDPTVLEPTSGKGVDDDGIL